MSLELKKFREPSRVKTSHVEPPPAFGSTRGRFKPFKVAASTASTALPLQFMSRHPGDASVSLPRQPTGAALSRPCRFEPLGLY